MERKVTTVKMVYATQVINSSDDYPSPSQFEEWKLQAQMGDFSKSTLDLPVSSKSAIEDGLKRPSVQLNRYNKIERRPPVIPECEILDDDNSKSLVRENVKTSILKSSRDRPSIYEKGNNSRCNTIGHMKSSTSLANIASDIVVVSAGWFSSLRRPGRKRKKKNESNCSIKAKSAWDLSNLAKLVCV